MRILIATDTKVYLREGRYYADNAFAAIMKRYYEAFGEIILCTRTIDVTQIPFFCAEVTPYIIECIGIYHLKKIFLNKYHAQLAKAISDCNMVVARVPSIIAYKTADIAKGLNKIYLTEAMGCAWDAYWNHGLVGKLIAPYMYFKMKNLVAQANYVTYVTKKFLQRRYPCVNDSINASNVAIGKLDETILEKRIQRIRHRDQQSLTLLTAAAVDVRYKGHEYVIKSLNAISQRGIRIKYYLAGKGDQTFLRELAKKYQVEEKVVFLGGLSHEDVLKVMDDADVYIQPSKQEGLPRAMIEAMSRGCPVLGANTAGIPELISSKCLFKKGSVLAVINAMEAFFNENWEQYAIENFNKAREYEEAILNDRRTAYYDKIKNKLLQMN